MDRRLLRSLGSAILLTLALVVLLVPATGCADGGAGGGSRPAVTVTDSPVPAAAAPATPNGPADTSAPTVPAEPPGGDTTSTVDAVPHPGGAIAVEVVRVVDGDTIVVRLPDGSEEHVRYIGIDTPEAARADDPGEPLNVEAAAVNQELLAVGSARLEFDRDLRDRYRRLLAYVYVDGDGGAGGTAREVLVNEALVRQGLAEARSYPPNISHDAELAAAEREARAARRGIWGPAGE